MVYEIKKLIDYILNNNLNIDKSLFFTIVIGQISIYGILLLSISLWHHFREIEKLQLHIWEPVLMSIL